MYARVPQAMMQIVLKNRKIVPYHRVSPNTRKSVRLQSPSPIMAPAGYYYFQLALTVINRNSGQQTALQDSSMSSQLTGIETD